MRLRQNATALSQVIRSAGRSGLSLFGGWVLTHHALYSPWVTSLDTHVKAAGDPDRVLRRFVPVPVTERIPRVRLVLPAGNVRGGLEPSRNVPGGMNASFIPIELVKDWPTLGCSFFALAMAGLLPSLRNARKPTTPNTATPAQNPSSHGQRVGDDLFRAGRRTRMRLSTGGWRTLGGSAHTGATGADDTLAESIACSRSSPRWRPRPPWPTPVDFPAAWPATSSPARPASAAGRGRIPAPGSAPHRQRPPGFPWHRLRSTAVGRAESVEDTAETEQIGSAVDPVAPKLFRRLFAGVPMTVPKRVKREASSTGVPDRSRGS